MAEPARVPGFLIVLGFEYGRKMSSARRPQAKSVWSTKSCCFAMWATVGVGSWFQKRQAKMSGVQRPKPKSKARNGCPCN